MIAEKQRLQDTKWKNWGPYVSNRQWGNVREDYSPNGNAWNLPIIIMQKAMPTVGERKVLQEFLM
jgi:hypothetical protein